MLAERRAVRAAYKEFEKATRRYLAETTVPTASQKTVTKLKNNAATRSAQQDWHRALASYASAFDDMARLALSPDYDVDERRSDAAEAGEALRQILKTHRTLQNDAPALGVDYNSEYSPGEHAYSFIQKLYAAEHPGSANSLREQYEALSLPVAGFPVPTEAPTEEAEQQHTPATATRTNESSLEPKHEPLASFGVVLNGGGVKGLAFIGALLELQERVDIKFTAFGGTSAGAIAAASLAMGYDLETLRAIFERLSFTSFLRSDWKPDPATPPWHTDGESQPVGAIRRGAGWLRSAAAKAMLVPKLIRGGALYSSAPVGRFVQHLNEWKPDANGERRLRRDPLAVDTLPDNLLVVASGTGQSTCVKFSGDVKLDFAIRASMAIPGFFEPMRVGNDVYYDGGLVANFAFGQFIEQFSSHKPVGLYLYNGMAENREGDRKPSLLNLLKHVVAILTGQDEAGTVQSHSEEIVRIDTAPIGTVDFDLDSDDKRLLVESGRVAVMHFIYENPTALPVAQDMIPKRDELVARHNDVEALRKAAVVRWKGPHRRQRRNLLLVPALVLLALFAGLIFSGAAIALALTDRSDSHGRATKQAAEEPRCRIIISTNRSGARIRVDGVEVEVSATGTTQVCVQERLSPGVHEVEVISEGHAPSSYSVVVDPDQPPPTIDDRIEPSSPGLRFTPSLDADGVRLAFSVPDDPAEEDPCWIVFLEPLNGDCQLSSSEVRAPDCAQVHISALLADDPNTSRTMMVQMLGPSVPCEGTVVLPIECTSDSELVGDSVHVRGCPEI